MLHFKEPFRRMRTRHKLWKKKYPDRPPAHGPEYMGISNARPETRALINPPVDFENRPFDPLEFIEHLDELPFDPTGEPDLR
jgi:arylsulfatase